MKKLVIISVVILSLCSNVCAASLSLSSILEKAPLKQGVAYSLKDSTFNYLTTLELANWKKITLEAGYSGHTGNSKHRLVGVISYPIIELDKYVDIPILDLVELNVGGYMGFGDINLREGQGEGNNEMDIGISLTLINIKF